MTLLNQTLSNQIPPNQIIKTAGTWADTCSSNKYYQVRTAAAASFDLLVPILLPSMADYRCGSRLISVSLSYKIATAAFSGFAAVSLFTSTIPLDDAAQSGSAISSISLDSRHDTAAKRLTMDDHTLTASLTSDLWLDPQNLYFLYCSLTAAATSVFTLIGARITYQTR